MTSRVEYTRLLHQDLELNQKACVEDLIGDTRNTRERIHSEHRVAKRVKLAARTGQDLLELYEDNDGSRKKELDDISGDNVFEVFYERLRELRVYHRKNPQIAEAQAKASQGSTIDFKNTRVDFTGEEHGGRFVDLHVFYKRFVNMKIFAVDADRKPSYVDFLSVFDKFDSIPKHQKLSGRLAEDYRNYISELLAYLVDLFQRTQPLVPLGPIDQLIEADFSKRWERKQVTHWAAGSDSKEEEKKEDSNPLFCAACDRVFVKQSVFSGHLKGRKHKRNAERHALASTGTQTVRDEAFPVALIEERIFQYAELQRDHINDTLVYLQNKSTRTFEEIAADLEEEKAELMLSSDDEDDNAVISNPLNLPLGWDGKPIPFWLYKLHGLNLEFKCEICGNYTYRGPRAFRRHFREWRHAYGMRCLGIPNTDHFFNITTFKDAIALHKKLLSAMKNSDFKAEEEEEFEDDEGHVFNKKTYDDLKRQGLI